VFAGLPVIEIDGVLRRTLRSAFPLGAVGVVAAFVFHEPLVGPGIVLGLALAVANHRVFQASALRFITPEGKVTRRPFAGSVAVRLGACTAVAIGLLILVQPMGWGVIGGLMLFQLLLMVNALATLFRYQRSQLANPEPPDA
jgi:hypothetical protein